MTVAGAPKQLQCWHREELDDDLATYRDTVLDARAKAAAVASAGPAAAATPTTVSMTAAAGGHADLPGTLPATAEPGPVSKPKGNAEAASGAWTSSLVAKFKKGLPAVIKLVKKVGPSLPSPGDLAAQLLCNLLQAAQNKFEVDRAVEDLLTASLDYLDLVNTYLPSLLLVKVYRGSMDKYFTLLQEIQDYCQSYSRNNTCVLIFAAGKNRARADKLLGELDRLKRGTREVLLYDIHSVVNEGPHRHIRQPDLKYFWRKQFLGQAEVPWYMFLKLFPAELADNPVNPMRSEHVQRLEALLAGPDALQAFQTAVNVRSAATAEHTTADDMVSVYELHGVFDEGELEPQVKELIRLGLTRLPPPRVAF